MVSPSRELSLLPDCATRHDHTLVYLSHDVPGSTHAGWNTWTRISGKRLEASSQLETLTSLTAGSKVDVPYACRPSLIRQTQRVDSVPTPARECHGDGVGLCTTFGSCSRSMQPSGRCASQETSTGAQQDACCNVLGSQGRACRPPRVDRAPQVGSRRGNSVKPRNRLTTRSGAWSACNLTSAIHWKSRLPSCVSI